VGGPTEAVRAATTPLRAAFRGALLGAAALLVLVIVAPAQADDLLHDRASDLHYLQLMTSGAKEDDAVPVVLAIHGLGDRPESFRLLVDGVSVPARVVIPRAPKAHGADGFSWFDFRAGADAEGDAALAEGVRGAAGGLATLAGSLAAKHGGPSRVVVCGFSQGGMLSFALAALHPEQVAAAVPVSGYLPVPLWPASRPAARPLPKVLALAGEDDRVIPPDPVRWSVEALRVNGYEVELKLYPGVAHAISPPMRKDLVASLEAAVQELQPTGPPESEVQAEAPAPALEAPGDPESMYGTPGAPAAAR
jgi:phospholipase/carboxylesterase